MSMGNQFLRLEHGLVSSPAWRNLSSHATRLVIDMAARHNGKNNGAIPYSVDEAMRCLHCSKRTAIRAIAELKKAGLIKCTHKGAFDLRAGKRRASEWRIAFLSPATGKSNE